MRAGWVHARSRLAAHWRNRACKVERQIGPAMMTAAHLYADGLAEDYCWSCPAPHHGTAACAHFVVVMERRIYMPNWGRRAENFLDGGIRAMHWLQNFQA